MEPAPGSVTVAMSGAIFPGGQGGGRVGPVPTGPGLTRAARPAGGAGRFRRARRGGRAAAAHAGDLARESTPTGWYSPASASTRSGTRTADGGDQRAWPTNTWAKVGVDPQATARAVIGGWERGDPPGVRLGGLTAEQAWRWSGRP
jgi:hypothetical protein